MVKIGYIRISNPKKQDAASQRKLMVDKGIQVDNIFEDHGSGSVEPMKRTEFLKLIKYLDAHPEEVDELVVSEYSRIGRTVVESLHELLSLIRRGLKVTSLSKQEQMINDIPVMWQPAVISLMMGSAQSEREHIKERTKWGLDNARDKGMKLGRPSVEIDFNKVNETMEKYHLKERQAVRVIGYKESTFYAAKKKLSIEGEKT